MLKILLESYNTDNSLTKIITLGVIDHSMNVIWTKIKGNVNKLI